MKDEELKKAVMEIISEEIYIEQTGYMNGIADLHGRNECADKLVKLITSNTMLPEVCLHEWHKLNRKGEDLFICECGDELEC